MSPLLMPSAPVDQTRPLENGNQLTATEFLRRYEAMPEVKKAELINGIVYVASPVRIDTHGEPDHLIQGFLFTYMAVTPGVKAATNATVRLGADEVPQPDGLLRILQEHGGRSRVDKNGYLRGAPELVVEVAASSVSLDARQKLQSYRRAGVREYLLWRTENHVIDWWVLDEDDYVPLPLADDGIIRSVVFPGLWLNVKALLAGDAAALIAILQQGTASEEHAAFVDALKSAAAAPSEA